MKKLVVVIVAVALALLVVSGTAWAATTGTAGAGEVSAAATPAAGDSQAWLGIAVANLNEKIAQRLKLSQKEGAVVTSVTAKSPAAQAGVKVGDMVTAVNGAAVKTAQDVIDLVRNKKAGDTVTLSIRRGTESLSIKVTAASAPTNRRVNLPPEMKGLQAVPGAERFSHNYGSTRTYTDKDGRVTTVYSIPGIVTAISPTSITITPNNPQSRGGPFSIDGMTRVIAGARRAGTDAIAVSDKVIVVVVGDATHATAIRKVQNVGAGQQFRSPPRGQNLQRQMLDRLQNLRDLLRQRLQQPAPGTGA